MSTPDRVRFRKLEAWVAHLLAFLLGSRTPSAALRFVAGFLRPRLREFGLVFILGAMASGMQAFLLWRLKSVVDLALDPGDQSQLALQAALLLSLVVVVSVANYIRSLVHMRMLREIWAAARNSAVKVLLYSPGAENRRRMHGDVISRLIYDSGSVPDILCNSLARIIREPITIATLVIVLFKLNATVALIAIVVAPLLPLPVRIAGNITKKWNQEMSRDLGRFADSVDNTMGGWEVIRIHQAHSWRLRLMESINRRIVDASRRAGYADASIGPIVELISGAAVVACVVAASLWFTVGWTSGSLVAFCATVAALYRPIRALSQIRVSLNSRLPSLERTRELCEAHPVPMSSALKSVAPGEWNRLVCRDVSHGYDGGLNVLREVNVTIDRLAIVQIIGPNAAGKTTLLRLLSGAEHPSRGFVGVDEIPSHEIVLGTMRRPFFGYSPQDSFMFQTTIRENICIGRDYGDDELWHVLDQVGAGAFVRGLPHQLDADIGHLGQVLSAGFRQRVSIARALVGKPEVLLLDEPLSTADESGTTAVREVVRSLKGVCTLLFVSHQDNMRDLADTVLSISDGLVSVSGVEGAAPARHVDPQSRIAAHDECTPGPPA